MAIQLVVPLLRVSDVARSIHWYRSVLGFVADPFPAAPPYEFAILRHEKTELMLRRGLPPLRSCVPQYNWDVYLRLEVPHFREIFAAYRTLGVVTRQMELMPYGLVEFEISDPDGYVLCLSQNLEDTSDLQRPAV
jgi:catechol 2,3-dioxygenase-like lactoylglutathione lyase family enzyme